VSGHFTPLPQGNETHGFFPLEPFLPFPGNAAIELAEWYLGSWNYRKRRQTLSGLGPQLVINPARLVQEPVAGDAELYPVLDGGPGRATQNCAKLAGGDAPFGVRPRRENPLASRASRAVLPVPWPAAASRFTAVTRAFDSRPKIGHRPLPDCLSVAASQCLSRLFPRLLTSTTLLGCSRCGRPEGDG
jgi:hypothetical protein